MSDLDDLISLSLALAPERLPLEYPVTLMRQNTFQRHLREFEEAEKKAASIQRPPPQVISAERPKPDVAIITETPTTLPREFRETLQRRNTYNTLQKHLRLQQHAQKQLLEDISESRSISSGSGLSSGLTTPNNQTLESTKSKHEKIYSPPTVERRRASTPLLDVPMWYAHFPDDDQPVTTKAIQSGRSSRSNSLISDISDTSQTEYNANLADLSNLPEQQQSHATLLKSLSDPQFLDAAVEEQQPVIFQDLYFQYIPEALISYYPYVDFTNVPVLTDDFGTNYYVLRLPEKNQYDETYDKANPLNQQYSNASSSEVATVVSSSSSGAHQTVVSNGSVSSPSSTANAPQQQQQPPPPKPQPPKPEPAPEPKKQVSSFLGFDFDKELQELASKPESERTALSTYDVSAFDKDDDEEEEDESAYVGKFASLTRRSPTLKPAEVPILYSSEVEQLWGRKVQNKYLNQMEVVREESGDGLNLEKRVRFAEFIEVFSYEDYWEKLKEMRKMKKKGTVGKLITNSNTGKGTPDSSSEPMTPTTASKWGLMKTAVKMKSMLFGSPTTSTSNTPDLSDVGDDRKDLFKSASGA